ncbi:MAG: glycosyltransferase family 4 protein [Tahibacter sp.]
MRIALLAPSLSARDAVGTDVLEMALLLRESGHEVRLYADSAVGIDEGVHAPSGFATWLRGEQDCVIYHASIGWPRGEAMLAQCRARRVLRYHNITPAEFFIGYSRDHVRTCAAGRAGLPRLATLGFDMALACSRYNLDELVAHGFPASHGRVLAPLHRIEALRDQAADAGVLDRYNDRRCNLLMLGRVAPNKGHAALIDAFACYLREYEADARLLVVGKQDRRLAGYVRHLQQRAAAYGISEQLHFLDNVDEAKLKACWLVADALLTLSEHEGFCVPLVEAMALGVPIIARASSAIPDTLGDAGLLWESADPRLYAASVARLRRDPGATAALREAGRLRYRQHFRREVLARQLVEAIACLY